MLPLELIKVWSLRDHSAMGYIGLSGDNGKENGNYHIIGYVSGLGFRV